MAKADKKPRHQERKRDRPVTQVIRTGLRQPGTWLLSWMVLLLAMVVKGEEPTCPPRCSVGEVQAETWEDGTSYRRVYIGCEEAQYPLLSRWGIDWSEIKEIHQRLPDCFELYAACRPIKLKIGLSEDAGEIGLTKDKVQASVESRLRSARLYGGAPLEPNPAALRKYPGQVDHLWWPMLSVEVMVVGAAFSVDLQFRKSVKDSERYFGISKYHERESTRDSLSVKSRVLVGQLVLHTAGDSLLVRSTMEAIDTVLEELDRFRELTGEVTTWELGSTGTHGKDSGFIIQNISSKVDRFLVEYLRVNETACD